MHTHIGGADAVKIVLVALVGLGTLNLVAMKYKGTSSFWASYANLYGLS